MMNKREVKKMMSMKYEKKKDDKPHHSGKGTKARVNTAAEKHFFNSKMSD